MNILGGAKTPKQSKQKPQYSGVQVQTSVLGSTRPVVYGQTKMAGNMLWSDDFKAIAHKQKQATGGKGGGSKTGASVTYSYQTAVIIGLGHGPIVGIGQIWKSKNTTTLAAEGMTFFTGTQSQTVWGYLTTNHANKALAYASEAYVAASALDLGDSADISNYNFEVTGFLANAIAGDTGADPAQVIIDAFTNSDYGCNFPAGHIGSLTQFSNYARATGLVVSLLANQQDTAASVFGPMVDLCNAEFVDSGGVLTIVPYGDTSITANGATYTPPTAPLFDLTDDDFIADQGQDPVQLTRTRPADGFNQVAVEFLDRGNAYNTDTTTVQDLGQITLYGKLPEDTQQAHFFCTKAVATTAAQLRLQRKLVRNKYTFKIGFRYAILDPMDIVTITDANLGLNRAWVRIKEMEEDDQGVLTITAEEYLAGTGAPAAFSVSNASRYSADYNAQPPLSNTPVIFEPPLPLTDSGGLEVWAAVSGTGNWGGCDVWASNDGSSYAYVTRLLGSARHGVLTAALPLVASPDQTSTLAVDLSISGGQLTGGTIADANSLNTICYVDGEYVAYANATLTGTNKYNLTYLVRGAEGSTVAAHPMGGNFIRLDDAVAHIPVDQSRIGQTIYLKFVGFNATNGGYQDISTVPAYSYVIGGSALLGALNNPTQVTTNYVSGILQIRWTGITDIRTPIDYEIRKGPSFANSVIIARTPNLFYPAVGAGTYWISAHYKTDGGLDVYSGNPPSIVIAGGQLVKNVIATWDEAATSWGGTVSGGAYLINNTIMLGGNNNILADVNVLTDTDILFGGNVASSGTYTAPVGHTITLTQVASCAVTTDWNVFGQSIHDNVLSVTDILSQQDILGSQFNALIGAQVQVALSQDGVTFGAWQNFSPGVYTFMAIKFQMVLASSRPDVTAILNAWTYKVDVPDRIDTGTLTTSASAPLGFTYTSPFNGGANGNAYPLPQITIQNAQQGDDVVLSSMSLTGFSYAVKNAGSYVVRTINFIAQGY